MLFVGLDWASKGHAVCVLDNRGNSLKSFEVPHTEEGLKQFLRELKKLKDVSIAIERPDGVLVDTLLEAGHRIVPIHPNILKATRSRHRTAGKSDPGDAYILADLLRTDGHRFKVLSPHSAEVKALRVVTRTRKDLVRTRVAVANQLRSLLEATFPGGAELFGKLDCPISLAFLREYPTEVAAAKLDEKRLARFLRSHSYPGRRSARELLERMHRAPRGVSVPALSEASAAGVLAMVAVLEQLVAQIAALKKELESRLPQIPETALVQSFPGGGPLNAALIVTKLGQDRNRFQTAEQFASFAGVTPVTYSSGKQRGVLFRRHCDRELRDALALWPTHPARTLRELRRFIARPVNAGANIPMPFASWPVLGPGYCGDAGVTRCRTTRRCMGKPSRPRSGGQHKPILMPATFPHDFSAGG